VSSLSPPAPRPPPPPPPPHPRSPALRPWWTSRVIVRMEEGRADFYDLFTRDIASQFTRFSGPPRVGINVVNCPPRRPSRPPVDPGVSLRVITMVCGLSSWLQVQYHFHNDAYPFPLPPPNRACPSRKREKRKKERITPDEHPRRNDRATR